MAIKLSAPVGNTKRITKGKPVKNNKADVEIVQQMLIDNGGSGKVTGKCDSTCIKAIELFQKNKLKYKKPDGIVDPGMETFNKLLPKYSAAKKKRDAIKYVVVKVKGKEVLVTEKEFATIKADTVKRLKPLMECYRKQFKLNEEIYQSYLDTAMLKDGYLAAIANVLIVSYNDVQLPKVKVVTDASRAVFEMDRAVSAGDFAKIQTTFVAAEKAVNKLSDEMLVFLKRYTNSAKSVHTILKFTSATGFAIVGVLAGPVLVTGAGLTAGQAALVGGGGVAVLESMSKEIGVQAIGTNKSILSSLQDIAIDGVVGLATAGVGSKLKLSFIDDIAKSLAPRVTKKIGSYVSEKAIKKILSTYLVQTGKETVKSAVSETLKLFGKSAKSGSMPTEKDFKDAVANVVFTALSAGLVKNLQGANAKWSVASRDLIAKKLGPDAIARVTSDKKIARIIQAKVIKDINTKVGGVILKLGFSQAVDSATGKEKPDEIVKLAENAVLKDRSIQAMIDRIVKEHVEAEKAKK